MCKANGKATLGTNIDHIKPHRGNAKPFFDYLNTQNLCSHHHASAKQSHECTRFKPVGADGWPLEG